MKSDDKNPLLHFDDLPAFGEIAPQMAASAVDAVIAEARQAIEKTAANSSSPNWRNTVAPIEAAEEKIAKVWGQIEHLHSVVSDDAWRNAHRKNLGKVSRFYADIGQHEGLYRRFAALKKSGAYPPLPPSRKKIICDSLREFERAGVALPSAKKRRAKKISSRLADLEARFEENLLDATNAFSLDVADESAVEEMPSDLRESAARAARESGKKSGLRFTLQAPSYIAFMKFCQDRKLRAKMHRAYATRASEFGPSSRDNSPLIEEILSLRRERASLLGFSNYAAYALAPRMAENPAAARNFLDGLARRANPHAKKEWRELCDFAAESLAIPNLRIWDFAYASEQLRRRKFGFGESDLRPYFSAPRALKEMFAAAGMLFGIKASAASASVWNPEVKFFQFKSKGGGREAIGRLYLDLFARESKRGGAWMTDALSRFRAHRRLQLPAATINCNFAPPPQGGGGDAPMNFDEAATLFHEFGHALHHLLTEADDYGVSGLNGVEWDAVELPSQLMENFLWEWNILKPMTAHIKTGRPMPKKLFCQMHAARKFQAGLQLARQLEFALFDLRLHSESPQPFMKALTEVRREIAAVPPEKYDRYPCGFAHIFSGGYDAGYYSYLWAEMLSADAFAMFKEGGGGGSAALNYKAGMKFRREILAVGGSRPAMDSFVALRGRPPQIAPLLREYGILS